jgi:Fic family protein
MEDRIAMMLPQLNEMKKRLFLASEAIAYGHGGIAEVIRITGVSRNTVKRGINELKRRVIFDGRVRKSGGGRNFVENKYTALKKKSEN